MKFTSTTALLVGLFVTSIAAAPAPENIKSLVRENRQRRRDANIEARLTGNFSSLPIQGKEFDQATQTSYSTNWAGAVQVSPPAGTFTAIAGSWTLPTVSTPSGGSGEYYNSEWVGIDGDTCESAILQAGTVSYVDGKTTGAYAWYEWYPQAEKEITGFSVAAGDTVTVTIKSTSDSEGTVVIENGAKSTTITVSAPRAAATLCGENAEWILEDFSSGSSLVPFADFTAVEFTGCTATTSTGATADISGADMLDIRQSGTVLATATEVSATELKVTYG